MLTTFADDELLFDAISAGASGYVLKQIDSGELINALERIGRGESLLDPAVTQQVFKRMRESTRKAETEAFTPLTEQELKVLALVAQGKRNKEIAQEVFLSEKTVRNYVSSILSKLGLATRSEAAAYAVKHHIENFAPLDK
jgi:DNA-binding NarL/FixJ family response regulator